MDFRSKSVYECKHPVLLRRVSVPYTDRKVESIRPRKRVDHSTGEVVYKHIRESVNLDNKDIPLIVRCGKCENCRKYQNDEWSHRMIMELIGTSAKAFFITLSFSDKYYKRVSSVEKTQVYRDFVVPFKKRLRAYGVEFRFFCVSELGEQKGRFHFHMVLFVSDSCYRDLVFVADDFCKEYAPLSADYFQSARLYVKGSNKQYRLQNNVEVYLQYLIQRAWSDNEQRYECPPRIHIHKKDGKRVKSVDYPNQYGFVSCSQCETFGAMKYITSYSTKCLHDGISTYHRQSPALGKKYVVKNIRGSKDMLESGQSYADYWTYGSVPVQMPRYFIRKFMPDQKRYDRFWEYYKTIPENAFAVLVPKRLDSWDTTSFVLAQQVKMLKKPIEHLSNRDMAWLDTLEYVNDQLLSGVRKKFTNLQIYHIYQTKLKERLCTQSTKTVPCTSKQLTLF